MLHEITGDFIQAVSRRDHFVVFSEQLFEQRLFIGVEIGLCDSIGNAVVEIKAR